MSDSPMLSKMDALMKKHRGGGESTPSAVAKSVSVPQPAAAHGAPPPGAWLPVLTQVIERGTPPPVVIAKQSAKTAPVRHEESAAHAQTTQPAPPTLADIPPAIVSNELSEQLMSELTPRLSEVIEKQLAAELRKNLDQTVATLLSQLDVNVREIVREAVAEKLKQPRNPSN